VDLKPHRTQLWQNASPEDPVAFAEQVSAVCMVYRQAALLHDQGIRVVSTDEMTGIQALERLSPTKPPLPARIEKREQHYTRHGTQCLIANLEVATGTLLSPTVGDRRTEEDFAAHVERLIELDRHAEWVVVVDNLNIHLSESLVRLVAKRCGIEEDLGVKGKQGVLKNKESRQAFLEDSSHRIRFLYTPCHTSWLNQIELWFSILVRRLLKRASFASVEELKTQILAFIEYFNRTMAKPFRWTYAGRPLQSGIEG
jgi:transposase